MPPETFDREICADASGKKRQGKKGKGVKIEFRVYQIGNFLPGNSILRREKQSGKMTLPPQKNMPVTPLVRGPSNQIW